MKYKIIQNQTIIAVLDGLIYVKQQGNGIIVPCAFNRGACGILSEGGNIVWHLEGLPEFPSGTFDTVKAVEITDEEYDELRAALDLDTEIIEPEPVPEPEPEPEPEPGDEPTDGEDTGGEGGAATQEEGESIAGKESPGAVMSGEVVRQKVIALEEKVAELQAISAAFADYHVKASDSSVNSIAKIRNISSQTATEVSEITGTQEGATENNDGTLN